MDMGLVPFSLEHEVSILMCIFLLFQSCIVYVVGIFFLLFSICIDETVMQFPVTQVERLVHL